MYDRLILIPIVLLFQACGLLATPTPTDSGNTGQSLLGPICPVVREGEECPDQPYQATITVMDMEGLKIVRFETDEQGVFSIPLAPGEYVLHPEPPEGMPFPFADEKCFSVAPGEFTRLVVLYDSGIR